MCDPVRPTKDGVFPVVNLPFFDEVSLGNCTQFKVYCALSPKGDRLVVGVMGKGFYTFSTYVHWRYVEEKLKLLSGDSHNMSDFINSQLEPLNDLCTGYYQRSKGIYYEYLCREMKNEN